MQERTATVRERILKAAADLLAQGGREAASTRAISAAANVQVPTLYRQFGDLQGLLDAAAHETFAAYVHDKVLHRPSDDPIEDLRRGWDAHVAFGLANPAVYVLIQGDPLTRTATSSARDGRAVLHELVTRVAQAGRLKVSVSLAVQLMSAAGEGLTRSLIGTPFEARDPHLSVIMREAVLAAITITPPASAPSEEAHAQRVAARAVALQAVLPETAGTLSSGEQHLLNEWLDRLATLSFPSTP
ncbi:TetR/AcrR family transcriptional regulator [Deinococcus yavapaiensis]|uniref:TetR family transcriptional regulator n=1 Tax=Deinococcus yavapaiensis KR-236 TaxID=694435 RepID=A0A318S3B5_9DEIO|nr:TetR/AcrR family transcriptional regulator [Deinococcus yavapaiensis]PYE50509.1 TetR family transcriptional regulator [Deinococcus yavapaiensis KR-236]